MGDTTKKDDLEAAPSFLPAEDAGTDAALVEAANVFSRVGESAAWFLKTTFRQKYQLGDYVVIAIKTEQGVTAATEDHVVGRTAIEATRLFRDKFPGTIGYIHRVGDDI
jgi:hypothetical protein